MSERGGLGFWSDFFSLLEIQRIFPADGWVWSLRGETDSVLQRWNITTLQIQGYFFSIPIKRSVETSWLKTWLHACSRPSGSQHL